jgi:hypothetical protein
LTTFSAALAGTFVIDAALAELTNFLTAAVDPLLNFLSVSRLESEILTSASIYSEKMIE